MTLQREAVVAASAAETLVAIKLDLAPLDKAKDFKSFVEAYAPRLRLVLLLRLMPLLKFRTDSTVEFDASQSLATTAEGCSFQSTSASQQ